jgi:adenosine deaminase CECR1
MKLWKDFDTTLPTEAVANKLRHVGESPEQLGLDLSRPTVSGSQVSPELRAALGRSLVTSQYDKTMDDFLTKWSIIRPISKDPRTFYPLLREVARSAVKQNISYIEGLAPSDPPLVAAVAKAALQVEKETGVVIRVLANNLWGQKDHDVDTGMKTAHGLLGRGVVGFNMVADEFRNRPLAHYGSFKRLREKLQGLHVTLHAGEVRGSANNIVNSMLLGVERYGHATQVLTNPIAMALLYANKTPVEVSLISNLNVRALSSIDNSPMPKMLAWGVPVILSTDDPGIFSSTLSEEYDLAQREFNLSWGELKQISRNGILYSFLEPETKTRLLTELDRRLAAFEKSDLFLKFKK